MNKVPMTEHGAKLLKEELERLERVERPRISQAIAEARAHGDLKENAEYHAAREQQGFAEGRIADIKGKLSHAHVIDVAAIQSETVVFGATVTLLNIEDDSEITYQIVGDDEADLKQHKISINSPIARGIIGKAVDDEVSIQTPKGLVDYAVVAIEYKE